MCFSPEASFGAAAGLMIAGGIAWKKAGRTPLRLLAAIPFFFGAQQLMEGVVWMSNLHTSWAAFRSGSTYAFLFFAWIIWPLFIPVSLYLLEKDQMRRRILLGLVAIGVFVAVTLTYILLTTEVHGVVEDCSISYNFNFQSAYAGLFGLLYLSVTALPNLISSTGKMWILALVNFATYFVSKVVYQDHVISVWCFFAAISSFFVLYVIWDLKQKGAQ